MHCEQTMANYIRLILVLLDEVIRWLLATTWELVFLAFLDDLVDKLVSE